jgi:predicted metal-dependent hydrolase
MDEEVVVRRSRRARRWTLRAPWGEPALLTVPARVSEREVRRILEEQRGWLEHERARQVPRLGLDPHAVSEGEARRAVRELAEMIADEEAGALGVAYARIQVRDQRTRWGSCSPRGTLSFNWRLVLAPLDVLDYVVVHELCHLRVPDHSPRFWSLVATRRPAWPEQRAWLREHGEELLAFRPATHAGAPAAT